VKADPAALNGIVLKVNRAFEHLSVLETEMSAWNEGRHYRFTPEVKAHGAKYLFRVVYLDPIPIRWSVMLGEVVHDLRSALDHVVYQFTIDYKRRVLDDTGFPICTTRQAWEQMNRKTESGFDTWTGLHKIRGIGPGPHAFIEALQPYPKRRRPAMKSLRDLHGLWNQDKHRLVHLWGLRLADPENVIDEPGVIIKFMTDRVLHNNAIVARAICDPPRDQVRVSGKLTTSVAVKMPTGQGGNFWELYADVAAVVSTCLGAIGRADTPIDWRALAPHQGPLPPFP
jgi:hypothetical protein